MLPSLQEPAQPDRFGAHRDAWTGFALAVLACSALYAAAWMLVRWQLS
jgi:hypothetical protein